jgi:phosphoribosylanthranilate isomerase
MQLPYIVSTNHSVMFPVPLRVKVCCIASEEEAALAVRLGASAIGLVSRMPSGPGPIPESRIRDCANRAAGRRDLPSYLRNDGRADHRATKILPHYDTSARRRGRARRPRAAVRCASGDSIVQVVRVRDDEALRQAIAVAPVVDAILLEATFTARNKSLTPKPDSSAID